MAIEVDGLIPLPESSFQRAIDVLTRAYWNYELIVYVFPDEKDRRELLPASFAHTLKRGTLRGSVLTTSPNVEGMAVWTRSDATAGEQASALEDEWTRLVQRLSEDQAKRYLKFAEFCKNGRERLAPKPYMYLSALAVDPEKQGQGYCSKTLRPVFEYLDRIGLPCYLETQHEGNVPIYEHFGFEVLAESTLPGSDLRHWDMVRMPR